MKLAVLIGKSGSGKDSILNLLVNKYGYHRVVTSTTRPPRDGEIDGKDYFFLTEEEFMKKEFIEKRSYNTVFGTWYYGSTDEGFDPDGKNVIILDPDGAKVLKSKYPEALIFEIEVDDETRGERAKARGSFNQNEWNRRLEDDRIKFSDKELSVYMFINDNLEETVEEINNACLSKWSN